MRLLKNIFTIEKNPRKGIIPLEWIILAYTLFTLAVYFVFRNEIPNSHAILSLRIQAVAMMAGLWIVYRCIPCRFTFMLRCCLQMALLGSWYPDIYEFNRIFPNLDHVFAQFEQNLFGCQPALLFYDRLSHPIISELLSMGYVSYYFLMAIVAFYYFFSKYGQFEKTTFILMFSFLTSYVIFIFLPVSGPQYYFQMAGTENITAGIFPNLGHCFSQCQDCLPIIGWENGFFHHLLVTAHNAGERPIAAFPSSHVSVTLAVVILAFKGNRKLGIIMLIFFMLLTVSTVYVRAHYAIDAIAGIIWGAIAYFAGLGFWKVISGSINPTK